MEALLPLAAGAPAVLLDAQRLQKRGEPSYGPLKGRRTRAQRGVGDVLKQPYARAGVVSDIVNPGTNAGAAKASGSNAVPSSSGSLAKPPALPRTQCQSSTVPTRPSTSACSQAMDTDEGCSLVKPRSAASGSVQSQPTGSTRASTAASGRASDMDVDMEEADAVDDPTGVTEYANDIYDRLKAVESEYTTRPGFENFQVDLNTKMRTILVDWLVSVQDKYKLKMETMFLATNIIDRFLAKQRMKKEKLQLLGVTALLVAAKFEEIYPPTVKTLEYLCAGACKKEEILALEVKVLNALEFKVCSPTAAHFFERYVKDNGCTEQHRHLMQYLLELSLLNMSMNKFIPSHLAATAAFLSNKLLQQPWPASMVEATQLTSRQLKACASEMVTLLAAEDAVLCKGAAGDASAVQAVRTKFASSKYSQVALKRYSRFAADWVKEL